MDNLRRLRDDALVGDPVSFEIGQGDGDFRQSERLGGDPAQFRKMVLELRIAALDLGDVVHLAAPFCFWRRYHAWRINCRSVSGSGIGWMRRVFRWRGTAMVGGRGGIR